MPKRNWIWPIAALLLIAAAAWLMSRDEAVPTRVAPDVSFPRAPDPVSRARVLERQTLPVASLEAPEADAPDSGWAPPIRRDPLFAALPAGVEDTAMVLEVNALRHGALGELLVSCVTSRDDGALIGQLQDAGLDVLTDVDRFAFGEEGVVVTGQFQKTRWEALLRAEGPQLPYGEKGQLFRRTNHRGRKSFAASWNDQLLIMGRSEAELRAAIDRLEGRAPSRAPAIADEDAYGDLYGRIATADLARVLANESPELAILLEQATRQVKLNVDASGDLAIVADFEGQDPERLAELRRMMGGGLSLMRMRAQQSADAGNLAELLDFTRLKKDPESGGFSLELAVPSAFIEQRLKECVEENQRRRARAE